MRRLVLAALVVVGCRDARGVKPRAFTNVSSSWVCTLDEQRVWCSVELEQTAGGPGEAPRYRLSLRTGPLEARLSRFEATGFDAAAGRTHVTLVGRSVPRRDRVQTRRWFAPLNAERRYGAEDEAFGVELSEWRVQKAENTDLVLVFDDVRFDSASL